MINLKRKHQNTDKTHPPADSKLPGVCITITNMIESLAPGLNANYPELGRVIQHYLILTTQGINTQKAMKNIHRCVKTSTSKGYKLDNDSFYTALEGLKIIMTLNKFDNLLELDRFMAIKKLSFWARVEAGSSQAVSDLSFHSRECGI